MKNVIACNQRYMYGSCMFGSTYFAHLILKCSCLCFSMVALMSPEDSWVGRWQRIGKLTYQNFALFRTSVTLTIPTGIYYDLKLAI